jgi:hypothetical protein
LYYDTKTAIGRESDEHHRRVPFFLSITSICQQQRVEDSAIIDETLTLEAVTGNITEDMEKISQVLPATSSASPHHVEI